MEDSKLIMDWTENMVPSTTMNGDRVSEVIVKFSEIVRKLVFPKKTLNSTYPCGYEV